MGCNVSRLDANGGATLLARLRPLFLRRLEEIKARRLAHRSTPSKKALLSHGEDNPSNHHRSSNASNMMAYSLEDSIKKPQQPKGNESGEVKKETPKNGIGITTTICNNYGMKVVVEEEKSRVINGKNDTKKGPIEDAKAKIVDAFVDADEDEGEDDDDDDYDERMIGYDDDEAFPGSPSFRVFFTDYGEDSHNEIGKNDAFKETVSTGGDIVPSKESSVEKKMKRGRKKRSLRKVLPKRGQAAMKNLLNLKPRYSSSHSSHYHAHLYTGKPPT